MPLDEVLRRVRAMRAGLALLVLLGWLGGAALVLAWPRAHVAEAMLAPAETTGIAVSSLLAPGPLLGGGGLLDTRAGGNFAVYLGALRSAEAAAMLAAETPLLALLTERRAAGPMGALRRALDLRLDADADDARAWLEDGLAVTPGVAAVTWTLALAHRDPAFALDALRRLHRFAEAKVRADLADLARRRTLALEARLRTEADLFLRQSLYDLLAQQQRAGLVVASDEAVAARLVSAPAVELRPSRPDRPLLLALLAVAVPLAVLLGAACRALLAGDPPPRRGLRPPGGAPRARAEAPATVPAE